MKFGIGLPIVQQVPSRAAAWEAEARPSDLVAVAEAADRLGYAWLTCSDHVAVPATYVPSMGAVWYEPIATLAYLGALTRRIRLLSHVLVLPYRHPLIVAKSVATLDRLTGGRVIVGVGVGHLKPEFRALGVPFEERVARSDDALGGLRSALSAECSTYRSATVGWRDAIVAPRPVQEPHPPIWVGGNGEAALRRAMRYGDGWVPWEIEPEQMRSRLEEVVRQGAERSPGFEIVAPLTFEGGAVAAPIETRLRGFEDAGATAMHVNFRHRSLSELLDSMAEFASGFVR